MLQLLLSSKQVRGFLPQIGRWCQSPNLSCANTITAHPLLCLRCHCTSSSMKLLLASPVHAGIASGLCLVLCRPGLQTHDLVCMGIGTIIFQHWPSALPSHASPLCPLHNVFSTVRCTAECCAQILGAALQVQLRHSPASRPQSHGLWVPQRRASQGGWGSRSSLPSQMTVCLIRLLLLPPYLLLASRYAPPSTCAVLAYQRVGCCGSVAC